MHSPLASDLPGALQMRDDLLNKELPVPADIQDLASHPAKAQAAMLEVQEAGQGHKRKRSHEQRVQAAAEVADELAEQSEEAAVRFCDAVPASLSPAGSWQWSLAEQSEEAAGVGCMAGTTVLSGQAAAEVPNEQAE